MDNESPDIKVLQRVVWRSAIAGRVERFAALLSDPERQKHFGEEFVRQLSAKTDRLFRLLIVLSAIYGILMLSLFVARDSTKTEFQFLGYSFKNLGYYKEFLLLAAALLSPASSAVSAYHRYLGELRKVALGKLFPDREVLGFVEHIYSDKFFDPLMKEAGQNFRHPHGFTNALLAVFGLAIFVMFVALVFASLALQITVIQDVMTKPSSTPMLNNLIVGFSIAAIALSWLIGTLQLPLPEVDFEGHVRLAELKEQDFAKYQETMRRLAGEASSRERQWSTVFGIGAFALVYGLCAAYWPAAAQLGIWQAFVKALPGLGLMAALAPSLALGISRAIYGSYFGKYPGGAANNQQKIFRRVTRLVSVCRVAAFLGSSLIYSLLTLTAK